MARWLTGVLLLALWVSPASAACWSRMWSDALDSLLAARHAKPTTPATVADHAAAASATAEEQREASRARAMARCEGRGPCLPFVLVIPYLVILAVPLGIAFWWSVAQRRRRVEDDVPEVVSLLAVERIARSMQRRGGVLAAVGLVGVPVLVAAQMSGTGWLPTPSVVVSTIIACIGLRGFFVARGMLRMVESPAGASAEVIGATIVLRQGDDEMHVGVSHGAVARASRFAVPVSIAHR